MYFILAFNLMAVLFNVNTFTVFVIIPPCLCVSLYVVLACVWSWFAVSL